MGKLRHSWQVYPVMHRRQTLCPHSEQDLQRRPSLQWSQATGCALAPAPVVATSGGRRRCAGEV